MNASAYTGYLDSSRYHSEYINQENSKPRLLQLQGGRLARVHLEWHHWNQGQGGKWMRLVSAELLTPTRQSAGHFFFHEDNGQLYTLNATMPTSTPAAKKRIAIINHMTPQTTCTRQG